MKVEKNYNEKELIMTVGEEIDTVTAPDFENEIRDEDGKYESLILDCKDLEYISSAGLRVLIATQKKLQPQGIPFIIKNLNDSIKEIISVSGLDNILTIE